MQCKCKFSPVRNRLRPIPVLGIGIGLIPVVSVWYRYHRYYSRYQNPYQSAVMPLFVDYSPETGSEATLTPASAPQIGISPYKLKRRLFLSGGQIMTPRRGRLSDEHFEILLLLKANKAFK